MSEPGGPDSLKDLGERLARARGARSGATRDESGDTGLPAGGLALAVRVGVELVAALAVGVAIGFGIDRWFGTGPWGLIVFFFLGAAAGILNVYRAVGGSGIVSGPLPPQPPNGAWNDEDED